MQKTVSIALQGAQFTLEEAAYNRLHEYLESLKLHFAAYPERDEIIGDIEGRIAEHLTERLNGNRVATMADIDTLIVSMGSAEDLAAFDGASSAATDTEPKAAEETKGEKRLYRDIDNAMLGGVCAGMASYFDMDPTLVRILFVLFVLFTGFGILVYFLMWLIVPAARSQTDKLRMRGVSVNVASLEKQRTQAEPIVENSSSRWLLWLVCGLIIALLLLAMFGFGAVSIFRI